MEVIPAILPGSFEELNSKLSQVHGLVSTVQIDIVDGIFAPSKTWPYVGDEGEFLKLASEKEGFPYWEELDFEIDLMVREPERVFEQWLSAAATALIFHIESTEKLSEIVRDFNDRYGRATDPYFGVGLGVALNPSTPLRDIEKYIERVNFVQCMGSDRIGFQGTPLDPRVFDHIRALRERYPSLIISVDIGVTLESASKLVEAGANKLVAGSAIFRSSDLAETIKAFKSLK